MTATRGNGNFIRREGQYFYSIGGTIKFNRKAAFKCAEERNINNIEHNFIDGHGNSILVGKWIFINGEWVKDC